MSYLNKIKNTFDGNLLKVDQVVNLGAEVGELAVSFLKDLEDKYSLIPGFIEYKQKLKRVITEIEKIKNQPALKKKYEVIYNQAVVLVVSNFETFMDDIFREIVNNQPYLINWTEDKAKVDLSIFKYSLPTIGDLIIQAFKDRFNFQDLQSTLRFLEQMLEIKDILEEKEKDIIIFYQAIRHVIIHNSAKIDTAFIIQVRNTEYNNKYQESDEVRISESQYIQVKNIFTKFSEKIILNINKKHEVGLAELEHEI